MITKVGCNTLPFKAVYVREDEHAKSVMAKDRRYNIGGEMAPFPYKGFDWATKSLDEFSEDRNCDIIFGFNEDSKDKSSFQTYVEIIDKETGDTFTKLDEQSTVYADKEKTPFFRLRYLVSSAIMKYRREI